MPKTIFYLLALLGSPLLYAQDTIAPDGPYLLYEGDKIVAHWVWPEERRSGEVVWNSDNLSKLPDFPSFRPQAIHPDRNFQRSAQISFSADSVAVMSDIHGQYNAARKLLINAGVMDEDHRWTYGHGHLVIVGDVFDRGPMVNEALWLIHNLQLDAAAAGGQVHFLLGNHETMILSGDVRYLNKRYLTSIAMLTTPYRDLYGKDSYLGRWLRSLPLTVQVNDMVFVHGGFSKELLREVGTLSKINDTYHEQLIDKDINVVVSENYELSLLKGRSGPLWYRGYFLEKDFSENDIDRILKKLKASKLVVGHTSFNAIQSFFNGKVLAVDSSIKFGSTGEILLIENNDLERVTLYGDRLPLEEGADERGKKR